MILHDTLISLVWSSTGSRSFWDSNKDRGTEIQVGCDGSVRWEAGKTRTTMKTTVAALFSLLGAAAAFAPAAKTSTSSTAVSGWKDEMVGVTAPVGFFDPMGLSTGKSDATMNYYREAELKHGRVAMAACLGWFITAGGTHPFFSSLSDDPLKAAKELAPVGWLQFVLGCGAIEWLGEKIKQRPGYVPGDLLGAATWVDNSDEGWVSYQNKELNNGRLAMLAFMGIYTQDVISGDYGDMIFKH